MTNDSGPLMRSLLGDLAASKGLEYSRELLDPGDSEEAQAFSLLIPGAYYLLALRDDESFPSSSRRTRRRGRKVLVRSFSRESGPRAAILMSQAIGTYLADGARAGGHTDSASGQEELVALIQSHFPLSEAELEPLERASTAHRDRPADASDLAPANYRLHLTVAAIRLAVGEREFAKLEPGLMNLDEVDLDLDLVRVQANGSDWVFAAGKWQEAASRIFEP